MKRGWIAGEGVTHAVIVNHDLSVTTDAGRILAENDVCWLPPPAGTIFAVALNYADHASELEFKAPEEPLVFIKSASSLVGHNQQTWRPAGIEYMHYEAELAVVIGRAAHKVSRGQAMDYVGGYTLCNDYAIRDYLENYYRPNLRVKSHDTLTPLGPYIIDRDDVPDPGDLAIRTLVNDEVRQQGHTRDMIFDIPYLIAWLSAFMTLRAGDLISTGTPKGLSDVQPGDEVVIEIEGIGRLRNFIVSEAEYLSEHTAESSMGKGI